MSATYAQEHHRLRHSCLPRSPRSRVIHPISVRVSAFRSDLQRSFGALFRDLCIRRGLLRVENLEVANGVTLSLHSGRMHSAFFKQNAVGKRHTVYHDQMCHRSCCMQIQYLLVLLLSRHDKVSSEPAVSAATRSDHA